jgi:hypothetical protein
MNDPATRGYIRPVLDIQVRPHTPWKWTVVIEMKKPP